MTASNIFKIGTFFKNLIALVVIKDVEIHVGLKHPNFQVLLRY